MSVIVCDAIMGSGKSQSAIRYMNEHPEKHFIYIAPYLTEAERIADACPVLSFKLPVRREDESGRWSKLNDIKDLIKNGRNIASTHMAFRMYTPEMLEDIRRVGYTVIIDEAVQVLSPLDESPADILTLIRAGYLRMDDNGRLSVIEEYTGAKFRELFSVIKRNNLVRISGDTADVKNEQLFIWELPIDLFTAFDEAYILTYMFTGCDLKRYFEMHGVEYKYVNVARDDVGYYFSETERHVPEYCHRLGEMIHILEHQKMNKIGDHRTALSSTWYDKASKTDKEKIKSSIYNYFRNIAKAPSDKLMWTVFDAHKERLKGKGYTKGFVICSYKASNEYRDKTYLAYCCNMFLNPFKKRYLGGDSHGADDAFALSSMVQWIWRSAIRDGKEIYIYVPSLRMRTLLKEWIERVESGKHGWSEEAL